MKPAGNLRRSTFQTVMDQGTQVVGQVASSSDVKYGRIHEFGGVTSPHDIVPVKGQALAFMMGGKQVFAKIVHHPGSRIPERSFMRSSLTESREDIIADLRDAAADGVAA